ncbi:MAG: type II toxin-antitoxin system HicB family antitoxin [Thomasclavelia sp.]
MEKYYPAVFLSESDGRYSVTFPDLPEAMTYGENFEDAMEMAEECLGLCLEGRREDNEKIPEPCFDGIETSKDEVLVAVKFDSLEFNKKYNNKSVRKSVTIPSWLNDLAEKNNVNFSNVLQNALMKFLNL